jgi:hypothetical protein
VVVLVPRWFLMSFEIDIIQVGLWLC